MTSFALTTLNEMASLEMVLTGAGGQCPDNNTDGHRAELPAVFERARSLGERAMLRRAVELEPMQSH